MHLYKTAKGNCIICNNRFYLIKEHWDLLINQQHLHDYLKHFLIPGNEIKKELYLDWTTHYLQIPIGNQEVWAAGVTYLRSRDARMEESQKGGGADFYQKVYEAERPELFFKALPQRVAAHQEEVYIRKDSSWNVPEPELTLFINSTGHIQAYTIGNDMSSRSIEGENPLYLPQAKMYERSAAIGPCLFIPEGPITPETLINMEIRRSQQIVFAGSVQLNRMKRRLEELVHFLFSECSFPSGCFLMTGTGVVPPDDFTLQEKDMISIEIENIGILVNKVGFRR